MIWAFAGGYIISCVVKKIYKFNFSYYLSTKITLAFSLSSIVLFYLLSEHIDTKSLFAYSLNIFISLIFCFILLWMLSSILIKDTENSPIGYIKGAVVTHWFFQVIILFHFIILIIYGITRMI